MAWLSGAEVQNEAFIGIRAGTGVLPGHCRANCCIYLLRAFGDQGFAAINPLFDSVVTVNSISSSMIFLGSVSAVAPDCSDQISFPEAVSNNLVSSSTSFSFA